jgi:quinohemoprotein ethanol dehydrogenase
MKFGRSTIAGVGVAALALAVFGCGREERAPQTDMAVANEEAAPAAAEPATDYAALEGDGTEWPLRGGKFDEKYFSPLTQITKENVGTLGLAWIGDVDSTRGLEATPIVVDGVIYVTSTWSRVFAFEAASGEELWRYDPQVPRDIGRMLCCDIVNRGVAVHDGNVFFGTLDGRLISLDAKTGKPAWIVNTIDDPEYPYTITGAPRVIKGRVVIGNSGADRGVRGYVTAYDAKTGAEEWRFWVVPEGPNDPPENEDVAAALETWPDDPIWKGKGGGTAWDAMAFDPELDLLYIGTGNGGSWKRQRPDDKTDNLYVSSIVAVDPDTGKLAWHYQTTPGDLWDYTATNSIILADMEVDGEMRQVLFQAPKNGFFYLLDRKTGELLGADKYGAANWASHVDMETGRPVLTPQANFFKEDQLIYPNPNGAHDWQVMSFNPQTGLAYIPALDVPWVFSTKPGFRYFYDLGVPALHLERMTAGQPEVEKGGFLKAWDVANRKLKWKVPLATTWNSGTLTTASNLVFHASGDGYFSAYDAETGERLLHLFTGNSAMAAPVTYMIDGVQYVALLAGYGGSGMITVGDDAALKTYENTGRLLVFKLGGGDVPAPDKRETPLGPAPQSASLPPLGEDKLAAASQLYLKCAGCHSTGGGTPMLPNLSRVPELGQETFRSILLEGALVPKGMPHFGDELTQEDADLLYEYISRGRHNVPVENARWY